MARVIWGTCGRLAAHHAVSRRDSGPHRVSCDPRVAPVGYSETRGRDELAQVTTAEEEDVVDHFVGWSDLGVAVVPGELEEFQQVKRSFGSLLSEHLSDTLTTFASALRTADGHAQSMHFASNRRVSEPAYRPISGREKGMQSSNIMPVAWSADGGQFTGFLSCVGGRDLTREARLRHDADSATGHLIVADPHAVNLVGVLVLVISLVTTKIEVHRHGP